MTQKDLHANAHRRRLIDKALAIIGKPEARAEIEKSIIEQMEKTQRQSKGTPYQYAKRSGYYGVQTKRQKLAAKRLALALDKLERSLDYKKNPDLPVDLRYCRCRLRDSDEVVEVEVEEPYLRQWRRNAEKLVAKPLRQEKRSNPGGKYAANAAYSLLERYGIPRTISKESKFVRLASVIYGDPSKGLYEFCRAVKVERERKDERDRIEVEVSSPCVDGQTEV